MPVAQPSRPVSRAKVGSTQPKPSKGPKAASGIPKASTIPPPPTAKRTNKEVAESVIGEDSRKKAKMVSRVGNDDQTRQGESSQPRQEKTQPRSTIGQSSSASIRHSTSTHAHSPADRSSSVKTVPSSSPRKNRSLSEDPALQALVTKKKKQHGVARKTTGGVAPRPSVARQQAHLAAQAPPSRATVAASPNKATPQSSSPHKASSRNVPVSSARRPSQAADTWDPISSATMAALGSEDKSVSTRSTRREYLL